MEDGYCGKHTHYVACNTCGRKIGEAYIIVGAARFFCKRCHTYTTIERQDVTAVIREARKEQESIPSASNIAPGNYA